MASSFGIRSPFSATEPNELWLTDITEHPTDEGKLYVYALKDAWSAWIVGYSIAERMTASLSVAALSKRWRCEELAPARYAFGPGWSVPVDEGSHEPFAMPASAIRWGAWDLRGQRRLRRRQRTLGKLTPIEFETVYEVAYAA